MKRILSTFICLLLTMPAAAFPSRADSLIRETFKDNTALSELLDQVTKEAEGYGSAFNSVSIRIIAPTPELQRFCGEYSRSASFAEVSISSGDNPVAYYFSTSGANKNLKLCPKTK